MAVNKVQNIAPFIDKVFTITSPWWSERVNPITGQTEIHRGLDISTGGNDTVYSILTGVVHSKGYDSSMGNWIIIHDNQVVSSTYGYASLYMHLKESASVNIGEAVLKNQPIGIEGSTGDSTGIHLHVEMQNISRFQNQWHWSYTKSDYLDPTQFMGISNIEDSQWIYRKTDKKYKRRKGFPWYLIAKKNRFIV